MENKETLNARLKFPAPSKDVMAAAKKSVEQLGTALIRSNDELSLQFKEGSVEVPHVVAKILMEILTHLSQGNSITLIPSYVEMTTQEAADTLNISRPFLIKLLEEGKIPFRKTGSHRRILYSDLLEYKEKNKAARLKTLEELQKDAEDNDMGY